MASHVLWIDSVTRRLVSGFNSSLQAETPVFVQGDQAEVEIHLLRPTGNLGTIYAEIDLAPAGVRLAIGRIEAKSTSGSFRLGSGEDITPPQPFNASADALQSALNTLPSITGIGGISVQGSVGGPWYVYYNQPGVRALLTADPSLLLPISQVIVSEIRPGTDSVAAIHQIKLKQSPAAYQDAWSDLPPATVLITSRVPGGPSANAVQRLTLTPDPYGGSYTLRFGNQTTTPLTFTSSAQNIQDALAALPSIGDGNVSVVEVTTFTFDVQFIGTLANADQPLLVGDATSLLVHTGKLGEVSLNTPNIEDLLGGTDRVEAVLEVEITVGGAPRTYLQTSCVVLNDMIEGAPLAPIPFARAVLVDAQGNVIAPPNFWIKATDVNREPNLLTLLGIPFDVGSPINDGWPDGMVPVWDGSVFGAALSSIFSRSLWNAADADALLTLLGFSDLMRGTKTAENVGGFFAFLGVSNGMANNFFTSNPPGGYFLTTGEVGNPGDGGFMSFEDFRQSILNTFFEGSLSLWLASLTTDNATVAGITFDNGGISLNGRNLFGNDVYADNYNGTSAHLINIGIDQAQSGGLIYGNGNGQATVRMPSLTGDHAIEFPDQDGTLLVARSSSSAGDRTLTDNDDVYLFFTGGESNWTLPSIAGGRRLPFYIKVTATFLVVQRADTDLIFGPTSTVESVTLNAGDTGIFINDGTYWQLIYIPVPH